MIELHRENEYKNLTRKEMSNLVGEFLILSIESLNKDRYTFFNFNEVELKDNNNMKAKVVIDGCVDGLDLYLHRIIRNDESVVYNISF